MANDAPNYHVAVSFATHIGQCIFLFATFANLCVFALENRASFHAWPSFYHA